MFPAITTKRRGFFFFFLASGNADDLRVFVPRQVVLAAGAGAQKTGTRFDPTSAPFSTTPPQRVPRLPGYLLRFPEALQVEKAGGWRLESKR